MAVDGPGEGNALWILAIEGKEGIVLRHPYGQTGGMNILGVAVSALQHTVVMAPSHGRVREVMVHKLAPLHQHQRVLGVWRDLVGVNTLGHLTGVGERVSHHAPRLGLRDAREGCPMDAKRGAC